MATYKGNDIARPDYVDSILHLLGTPALNQPNVEEDLGMWPEAGADYAPKPGQKNYLAQDLMAQNGPANALAAPAPPSDLNAIRSRVASQYPALAPHLENTALQWGDPAKNPGGGHLEFFPAWESENPNPGKTTLEFYDPKMQGDSLQKAVAGDMLHHLGSVDPRTQQPVDPQWRSMRSALVQSLTPEQLAVDQRAYQAAVKEGEARPFDQWIDQSRADAYVRGKLTPDAADAWKNVYTPQQSALLGSMKQYLLTPPASPSYVPPNDAVNTLATRGIWAR